MNKLRMTLALCCVTMFTGIAIAQPPIGGGGNQAALDQLQGAADTDDLISIHQELDIPRGDTDASGVVSFVDFLILSGTYGQTGTSYAAGDLNLDGETGLADFSLLSQNFGKEGYQPEPNSRPPNANLGLWQNDGELIVSSAAPHQIGGLEIRSSNGSLVTGSTEDATPFTFFLSATPNNLSLASLGTSVAFDGDFHSDFGTTDSSSLTVSWFEPGSYDVYSLGFGEGDALTSRRMNPPAQPPVDEPDPPLPVFPNDPGSGQTADERFNQVASLSELIDLHQEADVPRGDFDANGEANFADFLTISNNYKLEAENYSVGDANLDGVIDLRDFAIFSNNFGQSGYAPDPPAADRVELTASIDGDQHVVINPASAVDLGGLEIESSNAALNGDIPFTVKADPFTFFLERSDSSFTLGSLGTFLSVEEPFTTNVTVNAETELVLRWFQRGSYEVFSTEDGASALTGAPLVGDIDKDGRVAFPDFLILSRNYGQDVSPNSGGDVDGDGNVGFRDFLLLSDNFGSVAATDVSASVPEPSAGLMVMTLVVGALVVRRRRSD